MGVRKLEDAIDDDLSGNRAEGKGVAVPQDDVYGSRCVLMSQAP